MEEKIKKMLSEMLTSIQKDSEDQSNWAKEEITALMPIRAYLEKGGDFNGSVTIKSKVSLEQLQAYRNIMKSLIEDFSNLEMYEMCGLVQDKIAAIDLLVQLQEKSITTKEGCAETMLILVQIAALGHKIQEACGEMLQTL